MVRRVITVSLFSLCTLVLLGCGDQGASVVDNSSSPQPGVNPNQPAKTEREPRRGPPPIEARSTDRSDEINSAPSTTSEEGDSDSSGSQNSKSNVARDEGSVEAASSGAGSATGETSKPSEPVSTAPKKKESRKSKAKARSSDSIVGSLPEMAEPSGEEGVEAGDTVIEITGADVDGEKFALSDYAGKSCHARLLG